MPWAFFLGLEECFPLQRGEHEPPDTNDSIIKLNGDASTQEAEAEGSKRQGHLEVLGVSLN